MAEFGERSRRKLRTCHPDLQRVLHTAIGSGFDFCIITGHRSKTEQEEKFAQGLSKLHYPHGKHNLYPSMAVDVAPWPINWKDVKKFKALAYFLQGVALGMGLALRWGGDWDRDYDESDESFRDLGHLELIPRD